MPESEFAILGHRNKNIARVNQLIDCTFRQVAVDMTAALPAMRQWQARTEVVRLVHHGAIPLEFEMVGPMQAPGRSPLDRKASRGRR